MIHQISSATLQESVGNLTCFIVKDAVPGSVVLPIIFKVHSDALSSLFNRWAYAEGYLPIFLFIQIAPKTLLGYLIQLSLKANH